MNKLYFLILMFTGWSLCNAQNLILNPGFETATVGLPTGNVIPPYPTFLDNWSAVNTDGEMFMDGSLAHTGTGFLSVLQNAGYNPILYWLGGPNAAGGYDRVVQIVPVSASTNYQLQFWVKSGNGIRYPTYTSGNLLVQVEQFNPSILSIDSFTVFTPLTWQQSTFNFNTGPGCTSIAILFSDYGPGDVDAWIDDIDLRVEASSGINPALETGISIYPNLVTDKLNITSNTNELLEIVLYDIDSRKLLQENFTGSTSLNTEQLPKGIYFYEVRNKSELIRKGKVVKY